MSESVIEPAETQSLADYIRAENAKEREEAGLEGDGAPLPEAETITAAESAVAVDEGASDPKESPAEPTAEEKQAERNADGTFKPKRDTVQQRIDKAIAKQREAERRAELAEARAREFEARQPQTQTATEPTTTTPATGDAPKLEDFATSADPLTAWTQATAMWAAKKALDESRATAAAEADLADRRAKAERSDADGRAQFSDWDEVIGSDFATTFELPPHLMAALRDSDQSAALRYYLASHPDETRTMAADPPVKAVLALGMLAARLAPASNGSGSARVPVTQAKPLTKPLRGSTPSAPSVSAPDPEKTSLADWIRINNAADRRRDREARGA